MARVLAVLALIFAVAAAGYLIFADTYSGQQCTGGSSSVPTCIETSSTLIEENGSGVLFILAIPVVLATAQLLLVVADAPGVLSGLLAAMFLGLCLIAVFTIGFYFLPAALLSGVAGALRYGRSHPQPA
jgi:hypothetical protein